MKAARLILMFLLLASFASTCFAKTHVQVSEGIDELILDLKGPSRVEQIEAAETLAQLGPAAARAVPDLIENIGNRDVQVSTSAGHALLSIGRAAVPAIIEVVREDSDRRYMAISLLGELRHRAKPAAPVLLKMLSAHRNLLGIRFARVGPRADSDLALIPITGSPAEKAGIRSGDRMLEIDGQSVAGFSAGNLSRALNEIEGDDVDLTVEHWAGTGYVQKTFRVHREAIIDYEARILTVWALGRIGAPPATVLPAIERMLDKMGAPDPLRNPDFRERMALYKSGISAIEFLQPARRKDIPRLVAQLSSEKTYMRMIAVDDLALSSPSDPAVVSALCAAFNRENRGLPAIDSDSIERALVIISKKNDQARIEIARKIIRSENTLSAVSLLEKLGPMPLEMGDDLVAALGLPLGFYRTLSIPEWAALQLGQLGPAFKNGEAAMRPYLSKWPSARRKSLLTALRMIDPNIKGLVSIVLASSSEDEWDEVVKMGDLAIPEASTALMQSPDAGERWRAARLLAKLGPSAIPELSRALPLEKTPHIRETIVDSIGSFGPRAQAAIPALRTAESDADPEVREKASQILSNYFPDAQNGSNSP